MSPADRKSIGQMSAEEALRKAEVKNERDLQKLIVADLRRRGVEVLWHRTDKRSAATVGWPDITFAVARTDRLLSQYEYGHWTTTLYPCTYEVKFGDGQLTVQQKQMAVRLSSPPNCWRWRCIRSFDEYLADLEELGIK